MFIHIVPYEWVEAIFGTWVADNFNTICLCLSFIGLIIALICGRKITFKIRHYFTEQIERQHQEPDYIQKNTNDFYSPQQRYESATGWSYDRDTSKWTPPETLSEESREKWRWDSEKRIWIDREKEARMERYLEYRRSQGKEPTFEEWKAQKLREQAASPKTQT